MRPVILSFIIATVIGAKLNCSNLCNVGDTCIRSQFRSDIDMCSSDGYIATLKWIGSDVVSIEKKNTNNGCTLYCEGDRNSQLSCQSEMDNLDCIDPLVSEISVFITNTTDSYNFIINTSRIITNATGNIHEILNTTTVVMSDCDSFKCITSDSKTLSHVETIIPAAMLGLVLLSVVIVVCIHFFLLLNSVGLGRFFALGFGADAATTLPLPTKGLRAYVFLRCLPCCNSLGRESSNLLFLALPSSSRGT